MRLAQAVDARDVHPTLWIALGALAVLYRDWTGAEMVVTSLWRPPGARLSLHSPVSGELVRAADIRRSPLDARKDAASWCRSVQARFGATLGVVLEPEWLTPAEIEERGGLDGIQPHVHVQLKPGVLWIAEA